MLGHHLRSFKSDEGAAIAPLYALAMFVLVGAAGIGFDYARLASLDTELQNAADHAALAAATQLDGGSDAITRATDAAQGGLVANLTLFANDGDSRDVDVPTLTFYATKPDAEADTNPVNTGEEAHFVRVTVEARTANYALTPIVNAIKGDAVAEAVAGLGNAICKTPPLMMCNPDEPEDNMNVDLATSIGDNAGIGLKLLGDGAYEPGNFGFLQTGYGTGANALLKAIGYNTPPGDCIATDGVDTQTGVVASVMDGFNTRFDVNAAGNSCPGGDVNCSPSINVKKDLVRGNSCGITGQGWAENSSNGSSDFTTVSGVSYGTKAYKPGSASSYPTSITPEVIGHPRDICHAWSDAGDCSDGRVGDGAWDIDAYMRRNHPSLVTAGVYNTSNNSAIETAADDAPSSSLGYPTRYQVYRWEIADYANRLAAPRSVPASGKRAYDKPVAATCLATGSSPFGLVPGGSTIDRRRISMAVINCKALGINGSEDDVPVLRWVDLFIVEPSISRTKCTSGAGCNTKYSDKTDLYVEIIGETSAGGAGGIAGQVVRRDVPYLIR